MPPLGPAPPLLERLLADTTPRSVGRNYQENIINYNASLAFASRQANYDKPPWRGPYCMRIHGQVHYHRGGLNPNLPDQQRQYAQLYILDAQQALEQRLNIIINGNVINRGNYSTSIPDSCKQNSLKEFFFRSAL